MKVLLLAGGLGTRLSEETDLKPKPMVEIGGYPILWHIMKIYSRYGFNDFVVLLGHKGYIIKEYFSNYFLHQSNITIDLKDNSMEIHKNSSEPWRVTLIDTGLQTMTGGRVKRVQEIVGNEDFMLTYGDGVGNVNITELVAFHKLHGKLATMTCVQPQGRFGSLNTNEENVVTSFQEKPTDSNSWINAGFFVCNSKVFDYIKDGDQTVFEKDPLESLANDRQLVSYKHNGFWSPMDTLRDKRNLDQMWSEGKAEWKVWE